MHSLIAIKQANGSYIVTCLQYVTHLGKTLNTLHLINNQQLSHIEKNRFRIINRELDITKHTHLYNRPDLLRNYPTQVSNERDFDRLLAGEKFTYLFIHDREGWKVYDSDQQELNPK